MKWKEKIQKKFISFIIKLKDDKNFLDAIVNIAFGDEKIQFESIDNEIDSSKYGVDNLAVIKCKDNNESYKFYLDEFFVYTNYNDDFKGLNCINFQASEKYQAYMIERFGDKYKDKLNEFLSKNKEILNKINQEKDEFAKQMEGYSSPNGDGGYLDSEGDSYGDTLGSEKFSTLKELSGLMAHEIKKERKDADKTK